MARRSASLLGTLLPTVAMALAGDTASPRLRPSQLLDQAERWVGQDLEVEIVEALEGPNTAEQLARAEYGQVHVRIPEGHVHSLALVPAEFRIADPNRYRHRFDRLLLPPLRVRGEILEDPELKRGDRRSFVLRVRSIESLPRAEPVRIAAGGVGGVAGVAELLANPERFDRAVIEIEGTHRTGFEVSALESKIWLERAPDARILGTRPEGWGTRRVRVVGTLFSQPNAHYGHLGAYPLLLRAHEIEYRQEPR